MNNNEIMVSIQCLTFNHEAYIRQCLDGFVMQKTNFRFEAIIHDDASTDGTADIVREYAEKYPDIIKPLFEVENRYSKNDGSLQRVMDEHSIGKFIAICEGDDYWTDPYKLQKQVDVLEARSDCGIAFCKVGLVNKDGNKVAFTIPFSNHINPGLITIKDFMDEEFYYGYWCFHTSSFLMRRDLYDDSEERKMFFRRFPYGDMACVIWCLLHSNGYYIDELCGNYRVMSGGYGSTVRDNHDFAIKQESKLIQTLIFLDNLTKGDYHKQIAMRILRANYKIDSFSGHSLWLFRPKYWKLVRIMKIKSIIAVLLKNVAPSFHSYLKGKVLGKGYHLN